jgi:hypothetical protein
VPRTLKNDDSSSLPNWIVARVNTATQWSIILASDTEWRRERLTERECEAPPSHVEWKCSTFVDRGNGEEEPDETKTPHEEGGNEAEDVEHFGSRRRKSKHFIPGKYLECVFAE